MSDRSPDLTIVFVCLLWIYVTRAGDIDLFVDMLGGVMFWSMEFAVKDEAR